MKLIEIPIEKIPKEKLEEIKKYLDKGIGKIENNKLVLNIFELLFLVEEGIFKETKKITSLKNKFFEYYLVFKDLTKKGFVVKTGLKYGFHFRIYRRQDYFNKEHSLYLVWVLKSGKTIESYDLISKFRVAHSVRKRVLFAFVDEEKSVIYYENKWLRI